MSPLRFPTQKTVLSNKSYSGDTLARIVEEIARHPRPFTGFIKVSGADGTIYFLFFLQSDVYAAGKYDGSKPQGMTITAWLGTLAAVRESLTLSVHETDPVLLKCLLIFLQDEPTAKAPATLIDLEQLVNSVIAESGDALIILERNQTLNFFFFKNGMSAQPHWGDEQWTPADDLSVSEQLLLYAFENNTQPVTVHVYRNVATSKSADRDTITLEQLLTLARQPSADTNVPLTPAAATKNPCVMVEIVTGPQKGGRLTAALPCVIGRKDCDLIVNDSLISRRHARIELIDGELFIEDLGSTNGTLLNGQKVKRTAVSPDDVLAMGETTLCLTLV